MRASLITIAALLALASPASAGPDRPAWIAGNGDRTLGATTRSTAPDGARRSHQTLALRGMTFDLDQVVRLGPDGIPTALIVKGLANEAPVEEHYKVEAGRYSYATTTDHGAGKAAGGAYYPLSATVDYLAVFAEALKGAPGMRLPVVPSGEARLGALTNVTVTAGGVTKTLTAYRIDGLDYGPKTVWFDGDHFFGSVSEDFDVFFLPPGWESVATPLRDAQIAAYAASSRALVERVAPRLTRPIVFRDVAMFDADALTFVPHRTVIVHDGRIAAVGAAATLIPVGSIVIDGRGKTLLPGLWDPHFHSIDDSVGLQALAFGITTVRDLGTQPAELLTRRRRVEAGQVLGPAIVPLLMIDGAGPRTAQSASVATDLSSGLKWVRFAKANGYIGIKLYGSLSPGLVAPLAAEAHRLGLRVQGHIPSGMRPLDAIRDGYDEITHLNFVMMQAMPQSVVDTSNGLQRLLGPGRYGGGIDLAKPPMSTLLDTMQARHIASDTTIAGLESLWNCTPGRMAPAQAPYRGHLPPLVGRIATPERCDPLPGATVQQSHASFVKAIALIAEMHRRGITIVAGSDAVPIDVVRDLELFQRAGMTPAEAIATATIIPARLSRMADATGSILVGKRAELLLVDGDPSRCLADLRRVDLVLRDGRWMHGADLRAAIGVTGMPDRCPDTDPRRHFAQRASSPTR